MYSDEIRKRLENQYILSKPEESIEDTLCPGLVSKWQICCFCFSRCPVETSEDAVNGKMIKVCSSCKKKKVCTIKNKKRRKMKH